MVGSIERPSTRATKWSRVKPDVVGYRHPSELLRAKSNGAVRAEVTSRRQEVINRSVYLESTRLRAVDESDGTTANS